MAQENYLCNVGPWSTDNFYEENNLYNVVPTSPLKSVGGVPTPGAWVAWVFGSDDWNNITWVIQRWFNTFRLASR